MHVPPGPLNQLMQLKTENASTLYYTGQIEQHPNNKINNGTLNPRRAIKKSQEIAGRR